MSNASSLVQDFKLWSLCLFSSIIYKQKEGTISLVYENINSFIWNVMMVVCMGKRDWGLLQLTPHGDRHIQSLASSCFFNGSFDAEPALSQGLPAPLSWLMHLLGGCFLNDWPPDSLKVRKFLHYIIFSWCPKIFPSSSIHMIHFYCPLFTLR